MGKSDRSKDPEKNQIPRPVPGQLVMGHFLERPNRFVAIVEVEGNARRCHMPNPGRMREFMVTGTPLLLQDRRGKGGKTEFQVQGVWYHNQWISLVSTLGNHVIREMIEKGQLEEFGGHRKVTSEYTFGNSRFDLAVELHSKRALIEIKSCTLVEDGVARFPDAPTTRGARHMRELSEALNKGWESWVIIFIPRNDAHIFEPNRDTDPDFARAFEDAIVSGVRPLAIKFRFDGESFDFLGRVPVRPNLPTNTPTV